MSIYRGQSGSNREIKTLVQGSGGINREVNGVYRGSVGVNRTVYEKFNFGKIINNNRAGFVLAHSGYRILSYPILDGTNNNTWRYPVDNINFDDGTRCSIIRQFELSQSIEFTDYLQNIPHTQIRTDYIPYQQPKITTTNYNDNIGPGLKLVFMSNVRYHNHNNEYSQLRHQLYNIDITRSSNTRLNITVKVKPCESEYTNSVMPNIDNNTQFCIYTNLTSGYTTQQPTIIGTLPPLISEPPKFILRLRIQSAYDDYTGKIIEVPMVWTNADTLTGTYLDQYNIYSCELNAYGYGTEYGQRCDTRYKPNGLYGIHKQYMYNFITKRLEPLNIGCWTHVEIPALPMTPYFMRWD